MRAAVLVLLLALPFSVTAQTPQAEQSSVSRFRDCVRSHAADAKAAGVRTAGEAANYAMKMCAPLFGVFLGLPTTSEEEALPPGIYRQIIREEWGDFLEQRGKR